MNDPFNELTAAEAERLALVVEECGELAHAIGKVLRHGYFSRHPADPNGPSNMENVQRECGDVRAVIAWLGRDIDANEVEAARREKIGKLQRGEAFLHHDERKP